MKGLQKAALKSMLAIALVVGSIKGAQAQYYWEEHNRLGIKIAPSLERWHTNKNLRSAENAMVGYSIGAFALFPIRRKFTIHTEVLWHSKGINITKFAVAPDSASNDKYKFRLGFLEGIAMASYVSGPLQIAAGPYIAYRMRYKATGFNYTDTLSPKAGAGDIIKLDYGIVGDISLRNDVYIIGLRGQYGIPKIAATENGQLFYGKAHFYSGSIYIGIIL
jgi:Outer membrane protein beta-barrel domain